ncbi:hypothetical protein Riv7116_5934 [Rivularia sp. PCC 7116]|nr:hypothetical protein Riv7116_5934 [Rivularia sp. PCC 7116]
MNLLLLSKVSPLNPLKLGDFKFHFFPKIGGWGAIHTFNQQRLKLIPLILVSSNLLTSDTHQLVSKLAGKM